MAWTLTPIFTDRVIGIWHVESSAANDIELIVTHGLRRNPLFFSLMPHNAQANAAGYWIDNIDATVFHLHKPNGGAGSIVHVVAWTLDVWPWEAGYREVIDQTG